MVHRTIRKKIGFFKKIPRLILSLLALNLILIGNAMVIMHDNQFGDKPLQERYLECLKNGKNQQEKGICLRQLAKSVLTSYSPSHIEKALNTITEFDKLQWCHEFMHYAGWEFYDKTKSLPDAFINASNKCDSGMFHGIVEYYISHKKQEYTDTDFYEKVIPQACTKELEGRNLSQGIKGLCYHGLGHGFMFITDNNLNHALRYCDYVGQGQEGSCYTGVFMENLQSKQVGFRTMHPTQYAFDSKNMDVPCNRLDQKYKELCYMYRGVANVIDNSGVEKQFYHAAKDCLKVDPAYQDICIKGVGSDIPNPTYSIARAGHECRQLLDVSEKAYEICIKGAVPFLLQIHVGNAAAAVEFCNVIEKDFKPLCYKTAGAMFDSWVTTPEGKEEKCKQFKDTEAQSVCMGDTISRL